MSADRFKISIMNVLIIEDETLAAERLKMLIQQYDTSIQIVEWIDTVQDAVDFLQTKPTIDLIFLDIQLADGLSFEIFEQVEVTTPIIFTTAYDEYALKAFKVNSIDYLLKPIDPKELHNAIDQYKKQYETQKTNTPDLVLLQQAMQMIQQRQQYKSRFVVKRGHHLYTVKVEDIAFFFSEHKTTWLKTRLGKKYALDYTLEQLKDIIEPRLFFRLNRKYFASIEAIKDVVAYSNSRLKVQLEQMPKDELILVSREKVGAFKVWLGQ